MATHKEQTSVENDPGKESAVTHPAGTGMGAVGGLIAGAAIGTVGGPIGSAIGAAIGAIAGGFAGNAVAENLEPATDDRLDPESLDPESLDPESLDVSSRPVSPTHNSAPSTSSYMHTSRPVAADFATSAEEPLAQREAGLGMSEAETPTVDAVAVTEVVIVESVVAVPIPDHAEVEREAYYIWEAKGRSDGHDLEDWLQAESSLLMEV